MQGMELGSFGSIKEAAEILKLKAPHICRCLREPHRSAGGYKFRYKEKV